MRSGADAYEDEWGQARTNAALQICDRCPVREACRDYMLETRPHGPRGVIAGGWVFRANGRAVPHPADLPRFHELITAAAVRLGEPIPQWLRS